MRKLKVYEVTTRKNSYQVIGNSVNEVKEFVEDNKHNFTFDMSGYFNVFPSFLDFKFDIVFTNDNENIDYINGKTNMHAFYSMLYTSTIKNSLIDNNKKA